MCRGVAGVHRQPRLLLVRERQPRDGMKGEPAPLGIPGSIPSFLALKRKGLPVIVNFRLTLI